MKKKTLSVITPVYNRADCVERCLASVVTQEVPEGWTLEHVVVDDGSVDGSYGIVETFSRTNLIIRHDRLPENRGTNAARNRAIHLATGKWIVFLDSDDTMLPGAVTTICTTIDSEPEFSHFLFATDDTSDNRESLGKEKVLCFEDFLLDKIDGDFVHVFLRSRPLSFPFDEELRIFEGMFFLKYYKEAGNIKFRREVLFHLDRKRDDHVSFSLRMTSDKALKTKLSALSQMTKLYSDDYRKSAEGRDILSSILRERYVLSVLSGDYATADSVKVDLENLGQSAPMIFKTIRRFRGGRMVWPVIKLMLKIKHKLRRKSP